MIDAGLASSNFKNFDVQSCPLSADDKVEIMYSLVDKDQSPVSGDLAQLVSIDGSTSMIKMNSSKYTPSKIVNLKNPE